MQTNTPAILVLAEGSIFNGISVGYTGTAVGEVIFNTAITGYQEIITDPSYLQQIVTLTYPHIGNVGVNAEDEESPKIQAAGLVIRDLSVQVSNWRSQGSLSSYLIQHNVVAIADIDTRRLTRILREKGAQNGCIMAGIDLNAKQALEMARAFPGLKGLDLAQVATTPEIYQWGEGKYHVVAYDYGIKRNILSMLANRNCKVTVVPAKTPAAEVIQLKPHGIFLSNGPGDPEPCDYAIVAIQKLLTTGLPIFGICLGHQLLGLASGARTVKMRFGHHGANHPVQDLETGKVLITSQNHGFAVDETSLPPTVQATHRSLFDSSLQGIRRTDCPAFSFQGHPEASPGPHDVGMLFDKFVELMAVADN